MTARVQPLDYCIIQTLNFYYRRLLLDKVLACEEHCLTSTEFCVKITVLDSIRWIYGFWKAVSVETINYCFARSKISSLPMYPILLTPIDPTIVPVKDITLEEPFLKYVSLLS